jgi:hypothetical protein
MPEGRYLYLSLFTQRSEGPPALLAALENKPGEARQTLQLVSLSPPTRERARARKRERARKH